MAKRARWGMAAAAAVGLTMAALGSAVAAPAEEPSMLEGATCGKAGKEDCPLQGWMKQNLQKAKAEATYDKIAAALSKLPAFAPPESGWGKEWQKLVDTGIVAAKNKDKDGVAATCTGCHTKYRAEYRAKYRDRPIPK
jgi:hypothetical protein